MENKDLADMQAKATLDAGVLALKAMTIINGGPGMAYFAFLGSIRGACTDPSWLTVIPLFAFALGAMSPILAMGATYLSNQNNTWSAMSSKDYEKEHWNTKGQFWQMIAIGLYISSLFFFVSGIGMTAMVISCNL